MVVLSRIFPTRDRRDPYRRTPPCSFVDPQRGRTVHVLGPGDCVVAHGPAELLVANPGSSVALVLHEPERQRTALVHVGAAPASDPARNVLSVANELGFAGTGVTARLFGAAARTGRDAESAAAVACLEHVRAWLDVRTIPTVESDTGGALPRRVLVFPELGAAETIALRRASDTRYFEPI